MAASLLFALLLAAPLKAESLRLEVLRPVRSDAILGVRVLRVFKKGEVPCPGAKVSLTLPGGLRAEERAEASGIARFDPRKLAYVLPRSGAAQLTAKARCGAAAAETAFSASAAELKTYLRESSAGLTDDGVRLAGSGKMAEARPRFLAALEMDPYSQRARFNLALVDEKLGRSRLAVSEYVRYLLLHPETPDRAALGRKVARLARGLKPGPPLPKEAADLFEKGRAEAAAGRYALAGAAFMAAQAIAPWWPEPYRAAGLVRELLATQGTGGFSVHCEAALSEFQSFLDISPRDPRRRDIESRIERLRAIRSGLKAPKQIRIQ
ncbi:MAG: hypothetical protein ABII00_06105 [Elusimicrobiota bacterium]